MASSNLGKIQAQIDLLVDQAQSLIDERNRALSLDITPSPSSDRDLERTLSNLAESIQGFQLNKKVVSDNKKREKITQEYAENYRDLLEQYKEDAHVSTDHLELKLAPPQQNKKQVRFRDERLVEVSGSEDSIPLQTTLASGSREELFLQPYKDDPDDNSYHDDSSSNGTSGPRPDMTNNQHLHQHQLVLQEQDQHLDRLASSVSRQHNLSLQIGDELDSHLELLDELDDLTDRSQGRLATAKQRLTKFSRKAKDNGSILTIAILFIVFIILLIVLK